MSKHAAPIQHRRPPLAQLFKLPVAPLVLFSIIALFFGKLLFSNLILAQGDTFLYIYPYWTAAAQALRAGRLPLWNPDLFMGAPLLANSQVGLLYPLNWPLWLLCNTPTAASLSILLHLWLAAGFSYAFARTGLRLRRPAAWLTAALFTLGGYLTAQVEHINQLQGLAWLPAVFWLLSRASTRAGPYTLGAVFGMQLLAGHTQATFITLAGAAVYAAYLSLLSHRRRSNLLLAGLLALLLAAAQILPTLELSRHSMRGGGLPLNQALSFSLHPLLIGRALLPGYGETIFSEYVAFMPLTTLLLAVIGLWTGRRPRRNPQIVALALVAAMGLFFALGAANPIYILLVRLVPGFGLFRAPARWLALYSFGMAGLAGAGLNALLARRPLPLRPLLITWLLIVLLLISWAFIAPSLTAALPAPPESPVERPSTITLIGWLAELLLTIFIIYPNFLIPISLISLFLASRALPYNHPTAPEAYHSPRPATAHLQAAAAFDGVTPPGRFLSISDIFFSPGDTGELASIYANRLDQEAFYNLIIASKQKEILAPNLSLTFGVPAVDGYDGGVLPLAHYVTLEHLLLPAGRVSMDGRLRENLKAIPPGRWLNLFNVRYLITDKVGDAWANGVFYDLQHRTLVSAANPTAQVAYLPPFEATGLGIISNLGAAQVTVRFADSSTETLTLAAGADTSPLRTEADGTTLYVTHLYWPTPSTPISIAIQPPAQEAPSLQIHGLSLIDERDGAFQSLVISSSGRYRLVHSGDVKIYENLDVLPRAFLVGRATWAADDEAALRRMQAAGFDPAGEVVLVGPESASSGASGPLPGRATVVDYRPERVELQVEAAANGWLVLSDAFYPGWVATVNGKAVPIQRADILFRALPIQAGSQRVVFSFRPKSVWVGILISGITLLFCLGAGARNVAVFYKEIRARPAR